jgi:hypothetical protein
MTLKDIRDRVRRRLTETSSSGFFSDAMLNDFINDAQADFVEQVPCLESSAIVPVVAGTSEYALPSDFSDPIKVQMAYGGAPYTIRSTRFVDVDPNVTPGPACLFYIRGSYLGLYPTPDRAGTLTLYYHQSPGEMDSDLDTPSIPTQFHRMLVPGALVRAKLSDYGKVAEASAYAQEWQGNIARAQVIWQKRNHDRYHVTIDPYDEEGGW